MNTSTSHLKSTIAASFGWLVLFALSAQAQTTITWNGAAGDSVWDSYGNWSTGIAPSGALGDTAQFDGTIAGPQNLTWKGTNNSSAPGIFLNMLSTQTDPLSIDSDGVTTAGLRLQGVSLASGVGALTFGNGVGTRGTASGFAVTINGANAPFANNSANTVVFNNDVGFGSSGSGAQKLVLTGNWTFHNNLAPTGGGSISLAVNSGTVNYDGVSTAFPNSTLLAAGTLTNSSGVINFNSGATLVAGGNQPIDAGTAGLGTINMFPGSSIVAGQYLVAGITTVNAIGIWNIYGGTASPAPGNSGFTIGATAGVIGQVNISGGSYTSTDTTANGAAGIYVGENGSGTLNVSSSGALTLGGVSTSSGLLIGKNTGASGIVNLGAVGSGGGTITAMRVWTGTANASSDLNFHGGTLKAATGANSAFMNGLTSANVYGEGAVIDDNGQTIYIGQSLLAPAGNGVNSIASFTGGSGYITAPYVKVDRSSGDTTGQYATAVAQVDLNPASGTFGQVTNVLITNPGINYTVAPTFTLIGGNSISPATVTGAAPTANVSGGLTKNGSGTMILAGANTFTNTTTVNAGRLILAGAQFGSKQIVVSDGATLRLALPGSAQVAPATLTVGTNTGATLGFVVSSTIQAPLTPGTLTLNGANTINIVGGNFVAGNSYPLIAYTTLAGSGTYSAGTLPAGVGGTITTSGNTIYFNVTGVTNTIWTGLVNGTWDIATTANWTNTGTLGNTYIDGSLVQFDDTGLNTTTVTNVSGTLSPGAILVTNVAQNYAIKTIIGGNGGLTKTGTANLTNTAANTYTGPTVVNQGQLVAGVASVANVSGALGLNSAVTMGNDPTAVLNLNNFATQIGSLTGGGPNAGNVVFGSGTLTVGGNNSSPAAYAGNISGSGGLTKIGAGTLTLSGTNTYSGATIVNGGTVTYPGSAVVNSSGGLTLGTGSGGAGSGGVCTMNVASPSSIYFNGLSYVGYLTGQGVLNFNGGTFGCGNDFRVGGSDVNGVFTNGYGSTVNMTAGTMNLSSLTIARGNNNQNGASGHVFVSGGTLTSTNDLVVAYAGTGLGQLVISGTGTVNVGTTVTKWLQVGEWDFTSTEVDVNGGNLNLNASTAIKFNTQNSQGNHTFNQNGGSVTFYSDFATTVGGTGNLDLQYSSGAATAPVNTYNLNGGTLTVPQVTSTAATCMRIFNFNGGILKPTASSTTFFNLGGGNTTANVRNGGAIVDSGGYNITIAQPLLHSTIVGDNATDGGLTKVGNGTLTMSGYLGYSGPTRVLGGALSLNGSVGLPYGNELTVSNATLALDASSGSAMNVNNASVTVGSTVNLALNQYANGINAAGTLTLGTNTTLNLTYGTLTANPTMAAISAAGGLTKGTNIVINVSATGLGVGVIPLITVGSGSMDTNGFVLGSLPSGVKAVLTNNTSSSLDLLITSAGQLLSWKGASADDSILYPNWNINTDTNWYDVINYPNQAKYLQYSGNTVGDNVIFGDYGYNTDGTNHVNLSTTVVPATVVFSSYSPYTLTGAGGISGATSLVLTNDYSSVFLGTSNSYTGGTLVGGGTLVITNDNALGAASGAVTMAGGTLALSASVASSRSIAVTANSTMDVAAGATGQLNGNITGPGGLTMTDNGTLIFGGTNNLAGSLQISQGTLTTMSTNNLAALVSVGNTAALNGVLTVPAGVFNANYNGGQFTSSLIAGPVAGSDGEITLNGGTLNVAQQLGLGAGTGGYAALSLNSGLLNCGSYIVVGFQGDTAVYNQRGGTVVLSSNLMTIAAGGTAAVGVANFSGGTFVSSFPASSGIMVGERGTGTMNVSGGALIITTNNNGLSVGPNASQTGWSGTLNLNGGIVIANKINKGPGTGLATVNFNGGTIKAAGNNTTFLNGMDVATVYGGGLTVDDGGNAITIPQSLTAASGAGVSSINLSDGGSGYIDLPIVTISGGSGSNATATATVSGGAVTGIVVTSPGTGYGLGDSLSVSFAGGGANVIQPTVSAVNLAPNTSGGLTKIGSGALTLTGNNNYTGNTIVGQGTLTLTPTWQATNSDIVVSNAATLAVTATGGAVTYVHNLIAGVAGTDLTTFSFGLPAGDPTSAVLECNNLTLTGTNIFKVSGVLTAGTFPVLKYHGTFTGVSSLDPVASMPHGYSGVVSNDNATSTIYVTVSGAGGIVWQGYNTDPAKTNLWDINLTTNWLSGLDLTTYIEGDKVVFDDRGSGTVLLSNTVSPSSVNISNSAVNYVIQGTGQITPLAGLTKIGSGTATLNVPGIYSVSTVVSNGTLSLGANQTFANLAGNGTVSTASGAPTVTVNNTANTTFSGSLQGALGLTTSGSGTLDLTGASTFAGHLFENSGTVIIDSGAVGVNSTTWCDVGEQGSDNATLTLLGTGSFTNNGDFNLGDVGSAVGTLNISNNATLTVGTGGGMYVASANLAGSTASGTVNQAGGTVQNNYLVIGGRGPSTNAVGTYNMTGGTLTDSGTAEIGGVGTGTLNVSSPASVTIGGTGASYVGYLTGNGTLNINGGTFTNVGELRVGGSATSGTGYNAYGAINMTGGTVMVSTTGSGGSGGLTIARGNNNQNSCSGDIYINGGTFTSAGDVVVGYAGTGHGHLAINGGTFNVATTVLKWFMLPEYDTTTGELDITNGALNLNAGSPIRMSSGNDTTGDNVINLEGGSITFYSDFATTPGGGNLDLCAGSTGFTGINTVNLDGGTLTVPQVTSSLANGTRVFNFNGGTLKPTGSSTTFFNLNTGSAFAYVRTGGATIDTAGNSVTITQALLNNGVDEDGGLTKNGNGTLTLDGVNTYTNVTTVNGGDLGGTGTIAGAVKVGSSAGLAPGDGGVGALTINGNITLNAGSTNSFAVNGSTPANVSVVAGANVAYGGVLQIVPSGTFTVGQQFQLFSGAGATNSGNFASIQSGSPSLVFGFTNGVLSVVSIVASNPTNITATVSGSTLSLSWPTDHLGWILQSQTNSLTTGLSTNWVDVAGSALVTSTNMTINPAVPTEFYRLRHP